MDVLVFTIDGVRYGVPATEVVELVRAVAVTPLPGAPPVVEGIIDVRGTLVPVYDTRAGFGHAARDERLEDHFILVRAGARTAALRADAAEGIVNLDAGSVQDLRERVAGVERIAGVARLPDGLLLIHDPAAFLRAAESAAVERALDALQGEMGPGASEP